MEDSSSISHHKLDSEEKLFDFTDNTKDYKDILHELANELVYNHLANSFGDDTGQQIFTEYIFDTNATIDNSLSTDSSFFGRNPKSYATAFRNRYNKGISRSCRNILVIGAGASFDSYPYIPLGETLRKALEDKFVKDIAKSELIDKKYKEDKEDIIRLSKGGYDFENCLSLLSNFFPADDLREEIQRLTYFRHEPSLFYEIVAHLFKHNFLDVIINFNFDELLDNALEEEVGTQHYYHIVHDGDCPTMADLVEDGRLKIPIYLKPHGTTRHTTTLRFTKRHYLDIPPKIKRLMEGLISGQRRQVEEDRIVRVNLICVGFDLTSLEFNEILNAHLPKDSRIYHIARGNSSHEKKKELQLFHLSGFLKSDFASKFKPIDIIKFSPNSLISPYAEVFSILWRTVYSRFQPMYRPRSIGRHEILSYLFYRKQDYNTKPQQSAYYQLATGRNVRQSHLIREYFLDRLMTELALTLHRGNGIVDVIQLLSSRIGHYFALYAQQSNLCEDEKIFTIYQLLGEFTREMEEEGDQNEFLYSRNVFRIIPLSKDELATKLRAPFVEDHFNSTSFYEQFCSELLKIYTQNPITASILFALFTSDKTSDTFRDRLVKDYDQPVFNGLLWKGKPKPLFNEICRLFAKSSSYNYFYIRSSLNTPVHYMWESYMRQNLLLTMLAYKYHFRHNFLNEDYWDVLLCVSESGSLIDFLPLLDENEHHQILAQLRNGQKRLVMICSYESVRQLHCKSGENKDVLTLIEDHKSYISKLAMGWDRSTIDLLLLPYWQHNHHTTLFLKRTNSKGKHTEEYFVFTIQNQETPSQYPNSPNGGFLFYESYYYYKKGFSNSINPIFFRKAPKIQYRKRLASDQLKLLSLYFTYVCRAIAFFAEVNSDKSWFSQLNPCFKDVATVEEYLQYTKWSSNTFHRYLANFLGKLYFEG